MIGKKLVILILTCGVLLALLAPALAQDTDPMSDPVAEATPVAPTPTPLVAATDLFVTSPFFVNVRSGPSTAYTILGKLTPADSLDISGQTADTDWLRVSFNGQEGWVFVGVVDVNGALETAPVVEAGAGATLIVSLDPEVIAESEGTAEDANVVVLTRFNTNLRSSFSTDADVLTIIPYETELLPEGRTDNSNWIRVTVDDQSGWIFAPILFFASGEVETLPVLVTTEAEIAPAQP